VGTYSNQLQRQIQSIGSDRQQPQRPQRITRALQFSHTHIILQSLRFDEQGGGEQAESEGSGEEGDDEDEVYAEGADEEDECEDSHEHY